MAISDAALAFAEKRNVPTEFVSEDFETWDSWIRERAFFMAGVEDARILQAYRTEIENIVRGESSGSESFNRLHLFLERIGYEPPEGAEGTIKDLGSWDRMSVAIDTNVEMARGFGFYQRSLKARRAFPAFEFIRIGLREERRPWADRWAEAYEATKDTPGATPSSGDHDRPGAALIGHPIWPLLNRFGNVYDPWDWGSGMGLRSIGRRQTREMGLLDDAQAQQLVDDPPVVSMNDGLEARPQISEDWLKEALSERLGELAEWDGDVLRFKDPNGTMLSTPEALIEIWSGLPPEIAPIQMLALRKLKTGKKLTAGEERQIKMLRQRLGSNRELDRLWELLKDER
ncbi:MAG: hypothetical protein AAGB14_00370 [Verrucomicrobiota bacterium]